MRAIFPRVLPDHGGRLELKLAQATDKTARYTVSIFTPLAEVSSSVQVDAARGALEFGEWSPSSPPAWLEAFSRSLLRAVLRTKGSDGDWPRRVTRWRPEPAARGSDPNE